MAGRWSSQLLSLGRIYCLSAAHSFVSQVLRLWLAHEFRARMSSVHSGVQEGSPRESWCHMSLFRCFRAALSPDERQTSSPVRQFARFTANGHRLQPCFSWQKKLTTVSRIWRITLHVTVNPSSDAARHLRLIDKNYSIWGDVLLRKRRLAQTVVLARLGRPVIPREPSQQSPHVIDTTVWQRLT